MSLKFSGDVRNDLYLTLEKGDFEKGGKSTGKNIEATVYLVNSEGLTLEVKKELNIIKHNVSYYMHCSCSLQLFL